MDSYKEQLNHIYESYVSEYKSQISNTPKSGAHNISILLKEVNKLQFDLVVECQKIIESKIASKDDVLAYSEDLISKFNRLPFD